MNYYAGSAGTFPICAAYIPGDGDVYSAATAGVYLLTVNQPTLFTVTVPAAGLQGTRLQFTFGITTPSGQTPPTGTITLEDPNSSYATIGTANVNNGVVVPASVYAKLAGNSYYAIYSGDGNYESQSVYGTILIENPLSSVTPAAIAAGSAATNVTLIGQGFTGATTAHLITSSGQVLLAVTGLPATGTATQFQATIPATYLQNAGELQIGETTGTGNAAVYGGPVQVQVFAPYTDSATVSANPASIPYGSALSSNLNAAATRGVAASDAAVPAGQVSFTLNGTGVNSTYSASLGTAQLSQVSTPGTYLSPFTEIMDNNGTGKLVAADLNGDGFADIVGLPAFYYGVGAVFPYLQVILSTGDNAFQSEQQVFTGCTAQDFAVGDINGDNIPDLVVACYTGNVASGTVSNLLAYYMLGNGDGTFQQPVAFGGNSFIGAPTQVVLGQFNNDGDLDIAVIDGKNGYVQVISPFGDADNPYGPEVGFNTGDGPVVSAGAADFNQDGLTDLALLEYSYSYGYGGILILNSQGNYNGFYQQSFPYFYANTQNMQSMTITDVNGDGYPDVAIADPGSLYSGDAGNILIFENDTYGNLNTTFTQQVNSAFSVAGTPFPTIGQPSSGAASAPGWNLVYTYADASNNLHAGALQRQNASSWTVVTTFQTGQYTYATDGGTVPDFIVTGDMNGDGYLDFALNGETQVLINDNNVTEYNLQPWYYSNDAQATLSNPNPSTLPLPGSYTLSMNYPGKQLYQANPFGNASPATTTITITQGTPTGAVTAAGGTVFGNSVTLNATVNGIPGGVAPTGTVTFFNGANGLGTATLSSDGGTTATTSLSTTQLTAGNDTITAFYDGDNNYTGTYLNSSTIEVNPASVMLNLSSSTTSTTAGVMVNFQVQAGGTVLPVGQAITLTSLPTAANVTLTLNSNGAASYNYGLFPPGNYTIGASYAGTSSILAASSNTVSLQVGPTPVSVTLTTSANPVTYPA